MADESPLTPERIEMLRKYTYAQARRRADVEYDAYAAWVQQRAGEEAAKLTAFFHEADLLPPECRIVWDVTPL